MSGLPGNYQNNGTRNEGREKPFSYLVPRSSSLMECNDMKLTHLSKTCG